MRCKTAVRAEQRGTWAKRSGSRLSPPASVPNRWKMMSTCTGSSARPLIRLIALCGRANAQP